MFGIGSAFNRFCNQDEEHDPSDEYESCLECTESGCPCACGS